MIEVIIAQIIVVLINTYIATTENKKNIYIVTFLFNFANLVMYLLNGDKATSIIYIVISLRSLIYIYKDRFKTIIVPIICILAQLFIGFTNIENIWQLIPIIVPCFVCYYMWFYKTTQQLRIWNAICNGLWGIYNFQTGLYIVMISRIITVIVNVFAFIKNSKKDIKK